MLDEQPLVNPLQFRFWEWISDYYMCTEGDVMNAALPSAFKLSSESKVLLSPDFKVDENILDEFEYRITEALIEKEKLTIDEISKQVGFQKVLPLLKKMIDKRMIFMEEELKGGYKPKLEKLVSLTDSFQMDEAIQQLMDELGKRAHKQLELVMAYISMRGFAKNNNKQISRDDLLKRAGSNTTILKALVDKGIFEISERVISRFQDGSEVIATPIELSETQKIAFDHIHMAFVNFNVALLHGVTSGGKTEIYIKLIEKVLLQEKQVLYLLPEIALTTQIISRLKKYFGDQVGIYHSRYSKDERAEVWNNLSGREKSNDVSQYKVILGPRSAIFLPYENLGLIIVDEEHDQSYKQFDPAPRYNARDAAIYLSTIHNAKVVLRLCNAFHRKLLQCHEW